MHARLAAVAAPGSIEARLGRVQQELFEAHGLLSAVALPPLVPVAFFPEGVDAPAALRGMEQAVRAPLRVRTTTARWSGGALYLGVDSGGAWDALAAAARGMGAGEGPAGAAPFAPAEGFFAGCVEADTAQRAALAPAVPALSFTSADLLLLEVASPRAAEWWRELTWEIVERRPLRGRRAP